MAQARHYDMEFKIQAVKLAQEIGASKAARELGVPNNTMHGWMRAHRLGNIDLGVGTQTPKNAMTLAEEVQLLRKQNKELSKVMCCISLPVSAT